MTFPCLVFYRLSPVIFFHSKTKFIFITEILLLLFMKTYHHPRRPADQLLCNICCTDRLILFRLSKVLEGECGGMGYRSYTYTWATVIVTT